MPGDLTLFNIYCQTVLIKCMFLLTHEDALLLKDTACILLSYEKRVAHTITIEKEIHLEMNSNPHFQLLLYMCWFGLHMADLKRN